MSLDFAGGIYVHDWQEKPTTNPQIASDVTMADHDRIEKPQAEVAELQKKLAVLTQK